MAFLAELKRRNVLRVGSFYVVAAWLVIQVVETIFPAFGFDDGAVRAVTIVSVIGLIPTLVLAWVFELTPEGVKKERDIDRSRSMTTTTGKKLDRVIMVTMAVALTYFAVDKFLMTTDSVVEPGSETGQPQTGVALAPTVRDASIAVLPFRNLSPDPDNEYFADGTTEEVMNLLANVRDLRVISRSSSFAYKDRAVPVRQIAEDLGVSYILEGSVRRAAETIRISAQLIDAHSDDQQWSDTWENTPGQIFQLQNEVASDIAAQLQTTLSIGDFSERKNPTENLDAYHLYLKARELWWERTTESVSAAIELFENAIELDPAFALAHAGLASALYIRWVGDASHDMDKWREQGRLAHSLEPQLAEPLILEADYALSDPDSVERGVTLLRRAIELEPKSVWVNHMVSLNWSAGGGLNDALALAGKAQALDPLQHNINFNLGKLYLLTGDTQKALQYLNIASDLGMGGYLHWTVRAIAHARTGSESAVRLNAEQMVEALDLPQAYVDWSVQLLDESNVIELGRELLNELPALIRFDICLRAGQLDCAFESFGESLWQHASVPSFSLIWLEEARPMREHAEFVVWMKENSNWPALTAYWSIEGWPDVCPRSENSLDCT